MSGFDFRMNYCTKDAENRKGGKEKTRKILMLTWRKMTGRKETGRREWRKNRKGEKRQIARVQSIISPPPEKYNTQTEAR